MKCNKAKKQQTEQVVLGVISNMTFFGKPYTNNNPLSVRKLKDS